jgi:hypothetical protein
MIAVFLVYRDNARLGLSLRRYNNWVLIPSLYFGLPAEIPAQKVMTNVG